MPHYLFQVAYTADAWGAQVKAPQNLLDRVSPSLEAVGGHFDRVYYAFGEYDVVGIAELPDNEAAAAWSIGVSAAGSLRAFRTTPLLTVDQGLAALGKAAAVTGSYRPPGATR